MRQFFHAVVGILNHLVSTCNQAIAKRANAFGMMVNYYNRKRLDIRGTVSRQ
jgi:hypothetical protein